MRSLIDKLLGDQAPPNLFLLAAFADVEALASYISQGVPRGNFSPLCSAATMDNVDCFRFLVEEHGYDPMEQDEFGRCPAHFAARHSSGRVLEFLALKAPASFNVQDSHGATALHQASLDASPMILGLMLMTGADPSIEDSEGATAIQVAVRGGLKRTAHVLANHGADPYVKDRHGMSAIRAARLMGWDTHHIELAYQDFKRGSWIYPSSSPTLNHRTPR